MFDRISISALKVVKSRSFETLCFTAKLSFDGVLIATVENGGTGGPNFVRALPGKQEQVKAAEAWAKSLPPEQGYGMALPMDLEFAISLVVDEMDKKAHLEKEFKKACKKGSFIKDGRIYAFSGYDLTKMDDVKRAEYFKYVHSRYAGIEIFAEMNEEVAFGKFRKLMKK